jgi:hypothetical protein
MPGSDFRDPTERAKTSNIQEYELAKSDPEFAKFLDEDANRRRPSISVQQQPMTPGGLTPRQMSAATQLTNSLKSHPAYNDMVDIATGMQGVEVGLSQDNGFGDITAINSMQRMVDPGATVRSEDVKLMQTASSFLARIAPSHVIAKLKTGDKLPPQVRDQMREVARQVYAARSAGYNKTVGDQYRKLAEAAGVPYELVGQEFPASLAASTPAETTGGPAPVEIVRDPKTGKLVLKK